MKEELSDQAPPDRYKFVYFTFLFLGMGLLMPFNTLMTALDYFIVKLPGHDVDFIASILANGPLFVFNLIMIIFSKYFPEKRTIGVTMMLMMAITLFLPFIPMVAGNNVETAWVIFIVSVLLLSSVNGMLQCMLYGFTGSVPGNYIAPLNTGVGVSGIVISVLRAISLIFFPTDSDPENPNFFKGSLMYFIIVSLILVLCTVMLTLLPRTEYYSYHMNQTRQQLDSASLEGEEQELALGNSEEESIIQNREMNKGIFQYMWEVHNTVLITGYGLALVYTQTFCVFPGVFLQAEIDFFENQSWEVWFAISLFNFADTAGRYASELKVVLTENTTAVATLLRFIPIAFAFLSAYDIPFFSHDVFKIANIILIGLSNGYVGNCQMVVAVNNSRVRDKGITSMFMSVFLIFGVTVGSLIASFGIVRLF
ncbi:unnamed protein product [Moneuplotes crassus]|uniref:Nucleoside transporter n=2 Tax=Euplotes crassus TaxID=5936 RepID=A0AAD1XFC8_EUPCR|nr:unnamed protein product [Moneuplotes crassus]